MKVKTESGVSITIIPEGSSKVMLFDRPVRVIELKEEETTQISALLSSRFEMKTDVELHGSSRISQRSRARTKQILSEGR